MSQEHHVELQAGQKDSLQGMLLLGQQQRVCSVTANCHVLSKPYMQSICYFLDLGLG